MYIDIARKILQKVDFTALKAAAEDLGMANDLQDINEISETLLQDESFLKRIHNLLFDVHVIDGSLVCPESGRKFPGMSYMHIHYTYIYKLIEMLVFKILHWCSIL